MTIKQNIHLMYQQLLCHSIMQLESHSKLIDFLLKLRPLSYQLLEKICNNTQKFYVRWKHGILKFIIKYFDQTIKNIEQGSFPNFIRKANSIQIYTKFIS